MQDKGRYGGLDRFRLFAAFLVVAIHTSPLLSYSGDADFFLTRVLGRIAVPFFFMVTGQFVLSECLLDKACPWGRIWQYVKKTALLYGISIALYMPLGIYAGHYKNSSVSGLLRMLVFDGTFYHLWYFPACITGVLLVYLMSRFMGKNAVTVMAAGLYIVGLFGDSYFGFIKNVPVIASFYNTGFKVFSYTRNGFFLAPVFLILGMRAEEKQSSMKGTICLLGLFLSFGAMTTEAFWLKNLGVMRHDSMYLALPFVMFFLYQILLSWRWMPFRMVRTASAWVYILHPAMIVAVRAAAKALGLEALLVDNSLVHYLAVVVSSVAAAFVISLLFCGKGKEHGGRGEKGDSGRAWIELDRQALRQNVDALRKMLPESCQLMPAVKADAYGHGAMLIAKELSGMGVRAFCVACAKEGAELRQQGIKGEILILGYTHPDQFPLLSRYQLTQTVVDFSYAELLNNYGKRKHRKIPVHVGIDTGMHRLGERGENIDRICEICFMKHLAVKGLYTHLCVSDTLERAGKEYTKFQKNIFYQVIGEMEKRGLEAPKIHLLASYGVLNYPELSGDYARVGIALYGVLSTREDMEDWKGLFHPVLSLKARVAAVKDLYAGEYAGYGMAFQAERNMKIAALAIGYADGLPRSLSGGVGAVLIDGKRAPVIGRICMDQTLVDVSGISGVKTGDVAVLIGKSGEEEISACDLAEWTGTISNEILSRMGGRLRRVIS